MGGHTKGPWELGQTVGIPSKPCVIGDGDSVVCTLPGAHNFCSENPFNARLIAAAPELLGQHEADMTDLDLLAKAIHAGDPLPELIIRITDMLNRKRAAIAKATGAKP